MNRKKIQRLYREEKANRAPSRRSQTGLRRAAADRACLTAGNQRWSLDFVSDQMTDGRRFRILEVFDDCTRECLALVADTSISGRRVARELDAIVAWRGKPAVHRQRQRHGADQQRHPRLGRPAPGALALHRPGQAPAERLQRELQWPACATSYSTRRSSTRSADARAKLAAWRQDFNEVRPHSSLGYLTPSDYACALSGENGRHAAHPDHSAHRPIARGDNGRIRSIPDSRNGWMRNGGQVSRKVYEIAEQRLCRRISYGQRAIERSQ